MSDNRIDMIEMDLDDEQSEGSESPMSGDRVDSLLDMDYDLEEEEVEESDKPELKKDQVSKNTEEPEEEKKEEEEEEEEEKEEKEEEEEEEAKEEKPSENKTYKYKVDGKLVEREHTDEEVNQALSLKEANLKRLNEVSREKAEIKKEKESFAKEFEFVKSELKSIKDGFESVINDFVENKKVTKNPVESIYGLLDKMGLDTAQWDKAAFFHYIPKVAQFLDMTDEGRQLFLANLENGWHKKRTEATKAESQRIAQDRAKFEQENSQLRQAGISTEDAQSLSEELKAMGIEAVNHEKIIEWKTLKPIYARAEKIANSVGKKEFTTKIAGLISSFPDITDDFILENLGFKEIKKKELDDKLSAKAKPFKKEPKKVAKEDEDADELFSIFRR